MTDIIPFPLQPKSPLDTPDITIIPTTLMFKEKRVGMYCDYEAINPKARDVLKFARRRYARYEDLILLEEIGFAIEIVVA